MGGAEERFQRHWKQGGTKHLAMPEVRGRAEQVTPSCWLQAGPFQPPTEQMPPDAQEAPVTQSLVVRHLLPIGHRRGHVPPQLVPEPVVHCSSIRKRRSGRERVECSIQQSPSC